MKSDTLFAELRREAGSPLSVRVPFSLFGIVGNFQFFLYGWRNPPPTWVLVFVVAMAIVMYPSLFITLVRMTRARGLLFGWAHPIAEARLGWWLLIWPSADEPPWRRLFSVITLAWVGVFSTAGFLRWGFAPN